MITEKRLEESLKFLSDTDEENAEANAQVDATRRQAYGSWGDQLDEIYHNIDAWKTRIQTIKDNNPKG